MTEEHFFKARARLILQLGDQLIKNENVAVLELVKNSYDAFAKTVKIDLEHLNDPKSASITVEDDGEGMDFELVRDVWLEPGSDYKSQFVRKPRTKNGITRVPLGEKGIGRFSAHKLGNEIELVSRKKGSPEVFVKIDWSEFGDPNKKYFEDVPVKISKREPQVFTGQRTGTRIVVRQMRNTWTRRDLRDLYRAVNAMCYPFKSSDEFSIQFHLDEPDLLKGLLSFNDIQKYALYYFTVEMMDDHFSLFQYEFKPWKTMTKKLSPRLLTLKSEAIKKRAQMKKQVLDEKTKRKTNVPINLGAFKIGKVRFHGFIFDRQRKTLELGVQDKQGLKDYLDDNGGVRVYRDGIRVYDYGERENDWLGLAHRRVDDPGYNVSEKLILAAVELDRKASGDLIEMTNREGFVENPAYKTFVDAVTYALGVIESLRSIDKERLRNAYGSTPKSEPVVERVNDLRSLVQAKIKDESLRTECLEHLSHIEEDYRTIRKVLLTNAESGLHLSVAIHEIEKIISELKATVMVEKASSRVLKLVRHLAELVDRYSSILRDTDVKKHSLKSVINDALFYIDYRLTVHGVKLVRSYVDFPKDPEVKAAVNLVMGAILNIIDNSIYWLDYYGVEKKRVFLGLEADRGGLITLLIADNGLGFNMPTEYLCHPFVTSKPGGIGLGLHLASEIMNAQGGALIFPDYDDYKLPIEFQHGAIIGLTFKAA